MSKTNWKKAVALLTTACLAAGIFSGCGNPNTANTESKKVVISVGNYPAENSELRESADKLREAFMKKYPDIEIQPDTWAYDAQTFLVKASANQLPTLYNTFFTEATKIQNGGYAADITEALRNHGILESVNPDLLELVTDNNGRVFGVPIEAYAMGLYLNKDLFTKAGLVNGDGNVKIPDTYQQLAEYAQIIKEKTGRAGFILPTTSNGGGWNFLNIAWSYGVEFVEQQSDGKWKAVFDTPEFRNALQYVYDLKWTYNALADNAVIDVSESRKLFGTGQGAMEFYNPPGSEMSMKYGMDKSNMVAARVPAGDLGRYAQMGGVIYVISPNADAEQIEAALKWMEFIGMVPSATEEAKQKLADNAKQTTDQNGIVLGSSAFEVWTMPEWNEAIASAEAPYVNINPKDYADYFSFKDVTIKPEPAVAAQELYAVLDKAIQEVITNKNANIAEITKKTVNDFQVNHLDKLD